MQRIWQLLFLVLAAQSATKGLADEAGRLPEDWFVLPEDQSGFQMSGEVNGTEERGGLTYRRGLDPVSKSMDQVFSASFQALDGSDLKLGGRTKPANAPADWVPWHLKEMIMDLGVSGTGTVGIVTATGEVSAEVYFQPTASHLTALGLTRVKGDDDGDPSVFRITSEMSRLEVSQRLDPVIDAVMATGRVENRGKVEEGLKQVAADLADVMTGVNSLNDGGWDVDRFRVDVSIDGSGTVGTGITAGLGVRLRFEWVDTGTGLQVAQPTDDPKKESFRVLMASLSRDLDGIAAGDYQDSGFGLQHIRLGIGLYGKAKFGVVKGKIEGSGFVYMKRRTSARGPTPPARIVLPDEIPLVDATPSDAHLRYATEHGVRHEKLTDEGGGTDKVVYYMSRQKFRSGLSRAAKMGAFFAKKAADSDSRNWRVYKIKPQFALSLEGATPMVTIGGKVSIEMEFKR